MLPVFHIYVCALLDPGAILSFATPCIVVEFGVRPKILLEPFSISTLVSNLIIARWVHNNCPGMPESHLS